MELGKCKHVIVGMKSHAFLSLECSYQLFYFNFHLSIVCKEELGRTLFCKSHDGMQVKKHTCTFRISASSHVMTSSVVKFSSHEHAFFLSTLYFHYETPDKIEDGVSRGQPEFQELCF